MIIKVTVAKVFLELKKDIRNSSQHTVENYSIKDKGNMLKNTKTKRFSIDE